MLDAQPSGDDGEPGRKAGTTVRVEGPHPPKIIVLESVKHAGVTVHRCVVASAPGPANVKQQWRTDASSLFPGLIAFRRGGKAKQF